MRKLAATVTAVVLAVGFLATTAGAAPNPFGPKPFGPKKMNPFGPKKMNPFGPKKAVVY